MSSILNVTATPSYLTASSAGYKTQTAAASASAAKASAAQPPAAQASAAATAQAAAVTAAQLTVGQLLEEPVFELKQQALAGNQLAVQVLAQEQGASTAQAGTTATTGGGQAIASINLLA